MSMEPGGALSDTDRSAGTGIVAEPRTRPQASALALAFHGVWRVSGAPE